MACRGSNVVVDSDHAWDIVEHFEALGHIVSHDGGFEAYFARTQRNVWKSFFANAGHKRFRRACLREKMSLINRVTKPVRQFRCVRWPVSKGCLKMESRMQNRLIASVQRLQPHSGEPASAFIAQRNRAASAAARSQGPWSSEHKRLAQQWYSHLLRPANHFSFASQLLRHNDAAWLQLRRRDMRPNSAARGTGTRQSRGFITPRWEEALLSRLAGD